MLIDLLHALIRSRYVGLGFQSKTLLLDRCTIHYYEFHSQTPRQTLLLVHGLGTSSSTWIKIVPSLLRQYDMVILDLPGFGFSTIADGSPFFSVRDHVQTLTEFIKRTLKTPFTLIGHSLGGMLAARFALDNPERVEHLVLIDMAGVYFEGVETLKETFDLKTLQDVRRLLNKLWLHYPWYFKPFAAAVLHDLNKRRISELVSTFGRKEFLNDDLPRLRVPCTLVWANDDKLFPRQTVEIVRQLLPHAQVHWIDKCGHVPQLEKPKELVRILKSILEEKTGGLD